MTPKQITKRPIVVVLTAALLAAMGLAGCTQGPAMEASDEAPIARLTATTAAAVAGETIHFDASESSDRNGAIDSYAIDFGDGTTDTFRPHEAAAIEHAYASGGAYTVTLSVTDDGAGQEQPLTGVATLTLTISERVAFAHTVASSQPVNTSVASVDADEVPVGEDAATFQLDANVTGKSPLHNVDVRVALVAPSGAVVAEKTVTVSPGGTTTLTLAGALLENDTYLVQSEALQGAADVEGVIDVLYASDDTEGRTT